jgi:hypothetical protein
MMFAIHDVVGYYGLIGDMWGTVMLVNGDWLVVEDEVGTETRVRTIQVFERHRVVEGEGTATTYLTNGVEPITMAG